jgi:hypothetical protein
MNYYVPNYGFTTEAPYNEVITHSAIYTVYLIELYANYSYRPRILIAELNDNSKVMKCHLEHENCRRIIKFKKNPTNVNRILNILWVFWLKQNSLML